VLGVDERGDAPLGLGLGDHVQADGGLARTFRAVDLDDAAARDPAYAERDVHRERARRDDPDAVHTGMLAEAHDRALAVGLLDLLEREVQHLVPFHQANLLVRGRDEASGTL
jgi:hypothetical protein